MSVLIGTRARASLLCISIAWSGSIFGACAANDSGPERSDIHLGGAQSESGGSSSGGRSGSELPAGEQHVHSVCRKLELQDRAAVRRSASERCRPRHHWERLVRRHTSAATSRTLNLKRAPLGLSAVWHWRARSESGVPSPGKTLHCETNSLKSVCSSPGVKLSRALRS